MSKLKVQDIEITVMKLHDEDYISLTDMLKAKDGDFFISDWLRNRNTVEFLGIWEQIHNTNFNYSGFATIKSKVGLNLNVVDKNGGLNGGLNEGLKSLFELIKKNPDIQAKKCSKIISCTYTF